MPQPQNGAGSPLEKNVNGFDVRRSNRRKYEAGLKSNGFDSPYSCEYDRRHCTDRVLLATKANVDQTDDEGTTTLMCASAVGHSASIEQLLAAKAPVDHADYEGTTALMSCKQDWTH